MSVVLMSKRELSRLDVLARLDSDRLTVLAAAGLMNVTPRQTYRLLRRYRDGGASAIANQRRGRPSNNRLPDVVRDHAIALVRERYADFGPTFAAEKLAERDDLRVSRETLRSWMRHAGIWMPRAERKRIQQPRHRREHIGELVQIAGLSIAGSRIVQRPAHTGVRRRCDQPPDGATLCRIGEHICLFRGAEGLSTSSR